MKRLLLASLLGRGAERAGAVANQGADAVRVSAQGTFADNLVFFAERVKVMSAGRLEIVPIPTGQIVPAFEVLDATHKKVIDGAHSSSAYWVGKNRAAALFGVTPGGLFGMDGFDYMGWLYDGGGTRAVPGVLPGRAPAQRGADPDDLGRTAGARLVQAPGEELGRLQGD